MAKRIALALILLVATGADAQTHVAAGGNLQTAIDGAACGSTITLEAGATWTGNYTLPASACTSGTPITLRTVTVDGTLGTGQINATTLATFTPLMATISTSNSTQALRTTTDASHWRFRGLIFQNTTTQTAMNIVQLGDSAISSVAALPAGFVFTQCIFRSTAQAHRGLQMNAADVTVRTSYFYDIRGTGNESHSMSAWNSPGPFLIEDNYIEAAAIGVLFGGAASGISGNIQSDIVFRRNTVTRKASWQADTGYGIKNLFELKNAQRVHVYGNLFEHNWPDGQAGFAIVLTVRANSAVAPWSTIQDVIFEHNVIRNVGSVFNIVGLDDQTGSPCNVAPPCASTRMDDVLIHNNLIYGVDRQTWDSPTGTLPSGAMAQINGGPQNLRFTHNTFQGPVTGNVLFISGDTLPGFVFENNIVQKQTQATGFPYDTFGVLGNAVGEGNITLSTYAPNAGGSYPNTVFTSNVLAGATAASYNNWSGNVFPSIATLVADWVDAGTGNYRLTGGSAYTGKGADLDAIQAAMEDDVPIPVRLRFR